MIPCIGHINRVFIVLIVTSFGLNAQVAHPKYNFRHLNVQNGLAQNIVYHFLQDSHGYMWIGTHNGLTMYDGIATTNFFQNETDTTSITGNFISSILEDSAEQVWIGNENGIELYNRRENSFSHYSVDRPDGTKDNTYCVLLGFVSANELWFLDTKTKSIRVLNLKTKRTSLIGELQANHANLYRGSGNSVHVWSVYDVGTIHQEYVHNKLVSERKFFFGTKGNQTDPALEVTHVLQQNDSTAWLSTNAGLVKLNPASGKYQLYNKWKDQTVNEIRYTAVSPKGQLWLGSGPAGVYLFDLKSKQFINNLRNNKSDPLSLCSDNIVSLYFDKTGNVWCGSYGNGSSYARIENTFFASHLSTADTQMINGSNGVVWLAADNHNRFWCLIADVPGLWILDEHFKVIGHKRPMMPNGVQYSGPINALVADTSNQVWCGTNKGLYRYELSTNRMYPVSYEILNREVHGSGWIRDMILLHDNTVLFSTFGGIYRVTNEKSKPVVTTLRFLKPGTFNGFGKLFQDPAKLVYIKSLSDSLYVFKPSANGRFDLIQSLLFKPGLNNFFSEQGDSIIYFATTEGVYQLNKNNFLITKANFSHKVPFLNICHGFKKEGRVWLFGQKGLYYFDERTQQGRTYTIEDGLPANEFSTSALVYTIDNKCVAGSSNGLVSFFPSQQQDSIYPPRPRITKIYVNDILLTSIKNSNEVERLNLSHAENTFSFDFAPTALQHALQSSFEFKLEGYDENWIKTSEADYTRYSKIPPGNYTFHLRALDAMGRISPFAKTLEIQIGRAFWQTSLFKTFAVILILSVGWLFSKWYLRYKIRKQTLEFEKQQAIERERTRIATDMHDDLGAGLSRIKFLSQALNNKKSQDESIQTGLEKIIDFSDEMTEKMGEIVWALNERNDTLADLVAYTRSYAMEYLANHQIACNMDAPMHLPDTFIAGEIRRNIFLTVKECLHNIVKHAGATKVNFIIELNHSIDITIHDNGKGIDWTNQRAFSNGLQNVEKRMKDIRGKAIFVNDQGTKVLLHIPLSL